jgi:hypothetical protein
LDYAQQEGRSVLRSLANALLLRMTGNCAFQPEYAAFVLGGLHLIETNAKKWEKGGIFRLRLIRCTFALRPLWPEGKFMNKITIPDRQQKEADSPPIRLRNGPLGEYSTFRG